jgi:predicted ATPase
MMPFRPVVADTRTATSSPTKSEMQRNESSSSTVASTERKLPSLSPMQFGSWRQQRKHSMGSRVSSLSGGSIGRNQDDLKIKISDLNHLFGRTEAQSLLQESFVRVLRRDHGEKQSVLVHGKAGTGKTALVMQFHDVVTSTATGYFSSGKFSQSTAPPFRAIIHALDGLCMDLTKGASEEDIHQRRKVLQSKISEQQLHELSDLLPNLQLILERSADWDGKKTEKKRQHGSKEISIENSDNHSASLFHGLLRALCHDSKPVVFFLDDLQWADDAASASFLSTLICDSDSNNLMFIGAYRDDVEGELPWMRSIDNKAFADIELDDLSLANVKDLLSDLTGKANVLPLARIIRGKTHGNPCAIIEFLELLQREELLTFSFQTNKWSWDLELIRSKTDVTENVYQILVRRIDNLSNTKRKVLNLAAIIGFGFDPKFLGPLSWHLNLLENEFQESRANATKNIASAAMSTEDDRVSNADSMGEESTNNFRRQFYKSTIQSALQEAEVEGLIGKAIRDSKYKFSHSLVHQSLCHLTYVGQGEREKLHLRIARAMIALSSNEENDDKMFMIAIDHYNRGSSSLENEMERIDLIKLNRKAAEKAKLKYLWKAATEYLKTAIALLILPSDWRDHYDLLLEVYSVSAEVGFHCGNMDFSLSCCHEVQKNFRSIGDKLRTSYVHIEILFAQQRYEEAIQSSVAILDQLGEKINKRPNKAHVLTELRRTKKLMNGMNGPALLSLPPMTDPRQNKRMLFLSLLAALSFFHASEELLASVILRMLQNSLEDGFCNYTPFALSGYAAIAIGKTQEAFDYGSLALTLCKRANNDACIPGTYLTVFCFLDHLRHPLENALEHLLKGYQIGIENGQVELGANCMASFAAIGFYSTSRLDTYIDSLKGGREQVAKQGGMVWSLVAPYMQAAENLTGGSIEDQNMSNGETFDERHLLNSTGLITKKNRLWWQPYFMVSYVVAYIFNDIELAYEARKEMKERGIGLATSLHSLVYIELFFSGLLNFARQRKRGNWRLLRQAKHIIKTMETHAKEENVNCHAMLLLLKAELEALLEHESLAKKLYNDAIEAFSGAALLQFQAIATERAAEFMLKVGNRTAFDTYIGNAAKLYSDWGALAKVQQLVEEYELPSRFSGGDAPPVITIRGKSTLIK